MDLKNRIVIVTGATSGVGYALTESLLRKGAYVVMFNRDETKSKNVIEKLKNETGSTSIDFIKVDFSSMESVKEAANEFTKNYKRLDVLINNAALSNKDKEFSRDGIEKTFAVNHLGYFLLTNLLHDTLKNSAPAKIINIASKAHTKIDFDNLNGEKFFNPFTAYQYSKMGNIYFTYELAERLKDSEITVNCTHPGVVRTLIYRETYGIIKLMIKLMWLFFKTPQKSASIIMPLIESKEFEKTTGKFFIDTKISEPKKGTYDIESQKRLWELSEKLTGVKFN